MGTALAAWGYCTLWLASALRLRQWALLLWPGCIRLVLEGRLVNGGGRALAWDGAPLAPSGWRSGARLVVWSGWQSGYRANACRANVPHMVRRAGRPARIALRVDAIGAAGCLEVTAGNRHLLQRHCHRLTTTRPVIL